MTVVETLLVLVLIPAVIYGLVTLIALWPKLTRARYRAGQDWTYDPVFWVADPAGVSTAPPTMILQSRPASCRAAMVSSMLLICHVPAASTDRGGARGNW